MYGIILGVHVAIESTEMEVIVVEEALWSGACWAEGRREGCRLLVGRVGLGLKWQEDR